MLFNTAVCQCLHHEKGNISIAKTINISWKTLEKNTPNIEKKLYWRIIVPISFMNFILKINLAGQFLQPLISKTLYCTSSYRSLGFFCGFLFNLYTTLMSICCWTIFMTFIIILIAIQYFFRLLTETVYCFLYFNIQHNFLVLKMIAGSWKTMCMM